MNFEINENELKDILRIIDICCQRGSFKAVEIEGIGKLYNNLLKKLSLEKEKEENDNSK